MATYGGDPIVCEECGKVLQEESGYIGVQYGICDECLAIVAPPNTGLQADGADEPEHTGIPETCKHPDCVRLFQSPAAKA